MPGGTHYPEHVMSLLLKVYSFGKPVSQSKRIVKGDQQACAASEVTKITGLYRFKNLKPLGVLTGGRNNLCISGWEMDILAVVKGGGL